jgi:AcrR family transcriptional regulator
MTAVPALSARSGRAVVIVAAARRILEEEGADALTMRRLASSVGMRAPSLYKHFPTKRAVEAALIEQGLLEFGRTLHAAVASPGRGGPVRSLLAAYRTGALGNAALYRLATAGPLPREDLAPGLEDWAGEPFLLATGDPWRAQALFSFAHGMVVLELDDRFPGGSDLDRTWEAGVAAFTPREGTESRDR